jgi:Protein of unknown function (DUF3455)
MDQRSPVLWIASALIAFYVSSVSADTTPSTDVPDPLKAPVSQVLSSQLHATGVQIYECRPSKNDATRFEWQFRAPEADLFDHAGKPIGKHYAGPTWEANDGSKVVGEVLARDNGPDPAAIPWLLLRASSATGKGIFGQTQSIQRLHTVGGKAPNDDCSQAQNGKEARVPYKADYHFYIARP